MEVVIILDCDNEIIGAADNYEVAIGILEKWGFFEDSDCKPEEDFGRDWLDHIKYDWTCLEFNEYFFGEFYLQTVPYWNDVE